MRSDARKLLFCWLAAGALSHAPAGASAVQPLEAVRAAAEEQVRQAAPASAGKLLVTADALDNRLRLANCGAALTAFLPSGANLGARATVGVRCDHGAQWTVYVPVNIESEINVLVVKRAVPKSSPVTGKDVEIQSRRVKGLGSAYVTSLAQLEGMRARRSLTVGSLLAVDALTPDLLVKRGQQVMLLATVGGIEVRANGVALSDGTASSRIRVRNSSSSKVVEGIVDSDSTVRITL